MTDYQKMAAEAKAAHGKREAEKKAEQQKKSKARAKYVDRAVSVLQQNVLPVLEKAAADLRKEDIDSSIETNFDLDNRFTGDPSVTFQCLGPKRPSDGWQFKTRPIFLSSNGESIKAGIGEYEFSKHPAEDIGTVPANRYSSEQLIERMIKKVIDFYYEKLAENHHLLC